MQDFRNLQIWVKSHALTIDVYRATLSIAMGSSKELEYQVLLPHDLSYLTDAIHDGLSQGVSEVERMLVAFISKLERESA